MITTDRETIKYYAGEAAEYSGFSEKINGMKMSPTVPFMSLLPPGGTILDAGCGPGRDSSMFKKHGYGVSALDACQEMVEACIHRRKRSCRHVCRRCSCSLFRRLVVDVGRSRYH